tara:strand:+ start:708 stop:2954 length:2247 start_codon:yes stop_codon:yes gene_type:complete
MSLRPRRPSGITAKFENALSAINLPGQRPLANVGADEGIAAAAFTGLSRFGDALLNEGQLERKEEDVKAINAAAKQGQTDALNVITNGGTFSLRTDDEETSAAYNKTLQASFFTNMDVLVERNTEGLFAKYGADPKAFADNYNETSKEFLNTLPEEWRSLAAVELVRRREKALDTVQQNFEAATENASNADLISNAADYEARAMASIRTDDAVGSLEYSAKYLGALDARSDLTPQQKAAQKLRFESEQRRQGALGDFEDVLATGLDPAAAHIDGFMKSEDIVDPDERAAVASEMAGMLRTRTLQEEARRAQAETAVDAEESRRIAELDLAISRDQASHADIEKANNDGLFAGRPEKYTQLSKAADSRIEEQRKVAVRLGVVQTALASGDPLDPANTDHQKGVDDVYRAGVQALDQARARALAATGPVGSGGPDQAAVLLEQLDPSKDGRGYLAADLAARTGILPDAAKADIRNGLAGESDAQARAADIIIRIDDANLPGNPLSGIPAPDLARARLINKMVIAGVEPKAAVERASRLVDPDNQATVEARKKAFKDIDPPLADEVADQVFDGLFEFQPDVSAHNLAILEAETRGLMERQYLLTGDANLSKTYALKQIQRTWGVTEADGNKRLMKYPPERFYGIGEDDGEWMQKQLLEDIKTAGSVAETVYIEADQRTAREADRGRPSWLVIVPDETGALTPIVGEDGQPLRWMPDNTKPRADASKRYLERAKSRRAYYQQIDARRGKGMR